MPFWPVAAREARSAARAPRTYAWRAAVAAIGIAVIPITVWGSNSGAALGHSVFVGVGIVAFLYCIFGGILRTADAISEEKRENTLGLLFLTDLKVGDVLSGKLLASSATLFLGLLAILPLLVIPVLLGGVSSRDLVRMALCLVSSLFFSISLGFLVSTFFRQGWVAISVALGVMLAIIFPLPILANLLPSFLESSLLLFSPGTMLGAIITTDSRINFWQTLAVTHLVAWLNLLYTAHYLPEFWQERPRTVRAQIRWEIFHRLRFGSSTTRRRFRTRLLNHNPLFWLSGREQVSSFGLMLFLIVLCGLSLVGSWNQVLYALIAIHGTLLVRMASAASHSLAEDRKSGALELLLATSLGVRDVLKGRWMALGRQFFGPILIATIWHLFTILWMSVMSPFPKLPLILAVAFLSFALAWIATGWFGMWMGLRARHPVAAIWGTLGAVILAPLLTMGGIFSLLAIFQIIPEYGYPGEQNFEVLGCAFWMFYLFALSIWTAHRVKTAFREAATDRYTDTQPIDWRPFRRLTWKLTGALALALATVYGVRAYINFRGERALQNALAAHPNFSLNQHLARSVPENENLAEWDFLGALNTREFYISRNAELHGGISAAFLRPWIPIGTRLDNWRSGLRYRFTDLPGGGWNTNIDAALDRLHGAAKERPFIQFTRPSANGMPIEQTYGAIANVPDLLAGRAVKRLKADEHPIDDILLALRFANCVTNDPAAVGIRKEMLISAIQPVYEGILDGRWTDSDLREIQNAFARIDPAVHFQLWREHVVRQTVNAFASPPPNGAFGQSQLFLGRIPYHLGNNPTPPGLPGKLTGGQARMINGGLGPTDALIRKYERWSREFEDEKGLEEILVSIIRHSLNYELMNLGHAQTSINLTLVACAIERYRLAHNKLPATLDELTPQFIDHIPNDFMTGLPLHYKFTQQNHGYRLYSVGENLLDDTGLPDEVHHLPRGQTSRTPRDWVWIYER